ncbi:uncharacterized protein LOC143422684 [Xylocopa sonorina]|uniref:uncharacterized protein LOC143422684 n=1 Tax=Xylocopa sonorina TaxID=1818115 RepID=UPI00403AB0BC
MSVKSEEGEKIEESREEPEEKTDKGKEEAINYSDVALDMSTKPKNATVNSSVDSMVCDLQAGPSCRQAADSSSESDADESGYDNNNNSLTPRQGEEWPTTGDTTVEEKNVPPEAAVNLCKKDRHAALDERLKDTFLYKIMTDPTFLENIQKNKQTRRYACQFCKQEFGNSNELADHMDVKKDESNQVVCCACKKTFAQKRYLRYHQRCHSDRSMFTCDICTKKYTRMDNLSRHNALHVNPDKFSCTYCEKTFARKDLLNKHLKCHDNKYRFFCEECQKYFKGPLTLDNHRRNFHSLD